MSTPDAFGPWADGLDDAEKMARLRSMRALCQLLAGPKHQMTLALAAAEAGDEEAAALAWSALETMPSRQRRNILASLSELMKSTPSKQRRTG